MPHICKDWINIAQQDKFNGICTALLEAGWVEFYTESSIFRVFKSNGKDDDLPPVYLKIWRTDLTTSAIQFEFYQHWVGSVGYCLLGAQSSIATNYINCRIYCNKHYIYLISSTTTNFVVNCFIAIVKTPYRLVKTVQHAVTAGTNVQLTLDSTDGIRLNDYKNIYGIAGEGQREIKVISIDRVNKIITVTGCSDNYISGALVGDFISTLITTYSGAPINAFSYKKLGTAQIYDAVTFRAKNSDAGNAYVHDSYYVLETMVVKDANRYLGEVDSSYFKFTYSSGAIAHLDLIQIVLSDDSPTNSIVTGFTQFTITDSNLTFVPDSLIGKIVVFISGTGSGNTRYIVGNTENTITFRNSLPTIDLTTGYRIVDEVYRFYSTSFALFVKEEF